MGEQVKIQYWQESGIPFSKEESETIIQSVMDCIITKLRDVSGFRNIKVTVDVNNSFTKRYSIYARPDNEIYRFLRRNETHCILVGLVISSSPSNFEFYQFNGVYIYDQRVEAILSEALAIYYGTFSSVQLPKFYKRYRDEKELLLESIQKNVEIRYEDVTPGDGYAYRDGLKAKV